MIGSGYWAIQFFYFPLYFYYDRMNGFDRLAPVYDKLAGLVFGKAIVDAQLVFLDRVRAGDRILILGGGTGWLLEKLLRKQPVCEVWYVESSSRMIELTRQ